VTLEIPSVTLDDAGRYTCRVSNALGKAESICEIIIDDVRAIGRTHSVTPNRQLARANSQPPGAQAPLSPKPPAVDRLKSNRFYRERSRDRALPRQSSHEKSVTRELNSSSALSSASTRQDSSFLSTSSGPGFHSSSLARGSRSVKQSTYTARSDFSSTSK
jgi:hypothetical protein